MLGAFFNMKIIKKKLGQETPLVWCGGEGVKKGSKEGVKTKKVMRMYQVKNVRSVVV